MRHVAALRSSTAGTFVGLAGDEPLRARFSVKGTSGLPFAVHDDEPLLGDLYVPDGHGPFPAFVVVHGGAFTKGSRQSHVPWARFLAAQGYAALTVEYRLARPGRTTFPECLWDVKAAIQYLRGRAGDLEIDRARIGVLGGSAGGYLAAMVALTAGEAAFANPYPDPYRGESDGVAVAVPIAGLFDLLAAWQYDRGTRPPGFQPLELFLGGTPATSAGRYVEASPLFQVTEDRVRGTSWLVAWGTHDEVCVPADQSEPFVRALQRAGALVRIDPIEGAPHFWDMESEVEAPGSYNARFAARLLAFLRTWCGW